MGGISSGERGKESERFITVRFFFLLCFLF